MLKEIQEFFIALSKHWRPLVTGVFALVVSFVVGVLWGDHAPWWVWVVIIVISVFVSSFLAWRTIKRESDKNKSELAFLNTPSVSIKLHEIDSGSILDGHIQTLYLQVTGVGVERVQPQVAVTSVEEFGKTRPRDLHIFPDGLVKQFEIYRKETVNLPIVVYDPNSTSQLRIVLPCKEFTSYDVLRADVFKVKVCAYAGPTPAELEFEFGVDDRMLWMRMVGTQDRIYSKVGAMFRRL
jgi:hypothetical protein